METKIKYLSNKLADYGEESDMVKAKRYQLDKLNSVDLAKGENNIMKNQDLFYLKWKDIKVFNISSNIDCKGNILTTTYIKKAKKYEPIYKPTIIVSYSRNMKGVDINNMM